MRIPARLPRSMPAVVTTLLLLAWVGSYVFEASAAGTLAGYGGEVRAGLGWFAVTVNRRAAVGPDHVSAHVRLISADRLVALSYPQIYTGRSLYHFYCPMWVAAACGGSAAAAVSALRRRRVRLDRGLCARCGYDLRASPDRCPECGAAAKAA